MAVSGKSFNKVREEVARLSNASIEKTFVISAAFYWVEKIKS